MEITLMTIGLVITLLIALLGWAWQIGFMSARIHRNEKDLKEIRDNEKEMRIEIRECFDKVYKKIDSLPCHNPKWDRGQC